MLRIISGKFRHRLLEVPQSENCRPTMDKIREAVFSSISNDVPNCTFLDLFSGSGAIGIEALSRGAKKVVFNEIDPSTLRTLRKNVSTYDPHFETCVILKKDWQQALIGLSGRGEIFDIVYLDPPYQMAEAVNKQAIEMMRDSGLLSSTAIVIAEQTINPEPIDGFTLRIHKYGRKILGTYKLGQEEEDK